MAVASLVLGIISIVLALFPVFTLYTPMLLGIVGIILGSLATKSGEKHGLAVGGLICSVIGLALSVIFWIACIACAASMGLL